MSSASHKMPSQNDWGNRGRISPICSDCSTCPPCKADDQRRGTVRCTWQDFIAAQRSPAAGSGSKKGSGREVECQGPRSLREIPVRTFCEEKEEGAGQAGFHQSV